MGKLLKLSDLEKNRTKNKIIEENTTGVHSNLAKERFSTISPIFSPIFYSILV